MATAVEPTITCADCGRLVEMAALTSHQCQPAKSSRMPFLNKYAQRVRPKETSSPQPSPSSLRPPSPYLHHEDDDTEIAYLSSPDLDLKRSNSPPPNSANGSNGLQDLPTKHAPRIQRRDQSTASSDFLDAYDVKADSVYSASVTDIDSPGELDEILGQLSISGNTKQNPPQRPPLSKSSSAPLDRLANPPSRRRPSRSCASCSRVLGSFSPDTIQRDSQAFCRACYSHLYLPKCRKCRQPIEGKAIHSGDGKVKGKYHAECFSCFKCSAPFPNRTFYVWEEMPYCERHYHKLAGTTCQNGSCGDGIEGPCVTLDDGVSRYHPSCFQCSALGCGSILSDWHYLVEGKPYCLPHAERLQQDRDGNDDALDDPTPRRQDESLRKGDKPLRPPRKDIKKRQTIIRDVSTTYQSPKVKAPIKPHARSTSKGRDLNEPAPSISYPVPGRGEDKTKPRRL